MHAPMILLVPSIFARTASKDNLKEGTCFKAAAEKQNLSLLKH